MPRMHVFRKPSPSGSESCISISVITNSFRLRGQDLRALINRRTRVVGIFPNEPSADRLIGAHMLERHEKWLCEQGPYLNMDRLETNEPNSNRRKDSAL